MNINEALSICLSNMKASEDFSDNATISSIKDLLSCIIDNPSQLINYANEDRLAVILSGILPSKFPVLYPTYKNINVRNLIFAISFYLFMNQLEKGSFYDRNWPAFITLMHIGRNEFAKLIVDTNPFAPERVNKIMGRPFDEKRSIKAAKGLELSLMATAKNKGFFDDDLEDWFDELYDDRYELIKDDPLKNEALPLYQIIGNYLKAGDVMFVNIHE